MNAPSVGILLIAIVLGGCASAVPWNDDLPRVPVYQVGEDTPGEYVAMGRVVVEQRHTGTSDQEFRVAMQRALGRAGAEAGADAVIVQDYVRRLPFAVRGSNAPRTPAMFEGTAVRWLRETCKSGIGRQKPGGALQWLQRPAGRRP